MIPVGAMNQRVTIRTFTTATSSATGEQTDSWTDVATVSAKVNPLTGRERYQAQAIQSALAYRVTMRYRSGVMPKMRLTWETKTLEIVSAVNEGAMDRFSILDCSEVT